jgi:hypothetical protein
LWCACCASSSTPSARDFVRLIETLGRARRGYIVRGLFGNTYSGIPILRRRVRAQLGRVPNAPSEIGECDARARGPRVADRGSANGFAPGRERPFQFVPMPSSAWGSWSAFASRAGQNMHPQIGTPDDTVDPTGGDALAARQADQLPRLRREEAINMTATDHKAGKRTERAAAPSGAKAPGRVCASPPGEPGRRARLPWRLRDSVCSSFP